MSVGANVAVSECEPTLRLLVVMLAVLPLIVPVPMVVRPSLKVTIPAADGLMVAVSVTVAPCTAVELGLTLSVVVVLAGAEPLAPSVADQYNRFVLLAPKASRYWLSLVMVMLLICVKAASGSMMAWAA